MNIAFSGLIFFIFISPGLIFYKSFYNEENTPVDFAPLASEFIQIFIFSFIIQMCGLVVLASICQMQITEIIRSTMILFAAVSDKMIGVIDNVASYWKIVIVYLLCLLLFAKFSGIFFRKFLKKYDLDHKISFFRIESPWYYWFKRNDSSIVTVITASLVQANRCYLYRGYLKEFFLDKHTGNLDRLVLTDVSRRSIDSDKTSSLDGSDRFYSIDGDCFVLFYNQLKTLNIQFLEIIVLNDIEN